MLRSDLFGALNGNLNWRHRFSRLGSTDELSYMVPQTHVSLGRPSLMVHTALAQLDEQFDARYVWKVPVEKDDVSLTGDGEAIGQRYGIGKATDDKPVI